jgi:hypothetical protein
MNNYQENIQDDILKMKASFEGSGDYMSGVGDGLWYLFNRVVTDNENDLIEKIIEARIFYMESKNK